MAVADQNIGPAVVVHIEESAAPAQELGVRSESRGEGGVFETRTALIVVQRRSIAGEIGFDDVEIAVHVIVCGRNAHAGLGLAIRTQRASCFDRDILELSVLLVVIKRAGGGIVGNINVGPPVVVEVGRENTESVRPIRA